ncbi:MAG: aminodeoxychorismate lyase [Kangiellaceae bacterium]|nr:aminodeoxychorismate lyase [Kangiellaceae bacterium]
MTYWLNGKPASEIAIDDRGLLYGDGFFSTIKVIDNKVERWPLHLDRISHSADILDFPAIDIDQLQHEIRDFIAAQEDSDGIIRLTISRGSNSIGVRGYQTPEQPNIRRILSWSKLPSFKQLSQGVQLSISQMPISINKALAGVKHLNRLDQVLAQKDIVKGCFDTLMLADDVVICGSKTNVYFHVNGHWLTPKLNKAGVNGTVRRWLLATQDNVYPSKFGLEILKRADYCLVSNALIGIIPVTSIITHGKKPKEYRFEIYPQLSELQNAYSENALYRL